jgi:C4-dicarboxylate-specific signal transduction histidine kinase
MKALPPTLAADVFRLLRQETGVTVFLLDAEFRVIWGNDGLECPLQHIPRAPGTYYYRTVRDAEGHCHQACPSGPDWIEGQNRYDEMAEDTEAVYQVTLAPRRDAAGRPGGFLAVQQDITSWKKADDRWCQDASREYLYHLAGGIAHEINNPLTILHGLLQEYACDAELRPEQRQDFQTMTRASNRIREFIRRLLAFSAGEPDAGASGDLSAILSLSASFFQEFFRIKGIRIEWQLPERWPPLAMNPGVFAKVAFNLIHYIADSIRTGGVIRVLTPVAGDPGCYRMVFSSNDFLSIPTHLSHMFMTYGGNGEVEAIHALGLSTAHDLVKNNRGHLRVERTAPTTLAFLLDIPLAQTGATAHPRAAVLAE